MRTLTDLRLGGVVFLGSFTSSGVFRFGIAGVNELGFSRKDELAGLK